MLRHIVFPKDAARVFERDEDLCSLLEESGAYGDQHHSAAEAEKWLVKLIHGDIQVTDMLPTPVVHSCQTLTLADIRKNQHSVDTFYLLQKNSTVTEVKASLDKIRQYLKMGGYHTHRHATLLKDYNTQEGVEFDFGVAKFVRFTPAQMRTMARHAELLTAWVDDMETMMLYLVNGRYHDNNKNGYRPMLKMKQADVVADPIFTARWHVDKKDIGAILYFMDVYQEEKSLAEVAAQESLRPYASLCLFSGMDVTSVLQMHDEGKGGIASDCAYILYTPDTPFQNVHCREFLTGIPVSVRSSDVYTATTSKKRSRIATWQKTLQKRRRKRIGNIHKTGTDGRISKSKTAKDIDRDHEFLVQQLDLGNHPEQRIRLMCSDDQERKREGYVQPTREDNANVCAKCKAENSFVTDHHLAEDVCTNCGLVVADVPTADMQGTTVQDMERLVFTSNTAYSYDPSNHWRTWLMRVQAKENTYIPNVVINDVKDEMHKNRIKPEELTVKTLRGILKTRGHNKYYDNMYKIHSLVTGRPPPQIKPEHEEILCVMFDQIQDAWEKTKPKCRKNRLSYSFLGHRFCDLQNWTEYLDLFKLLSTKKLYPQDKMWQAICQHLGWEYRNCVL
jgi:hypothetical protein